jgi:hypothetical protein
MALSQKEKDRLAVVLEVTNGDISRIETGIRKAISDVADRATRKHLWCVLTKEARKALAPKRKRISKNVARESDDILSKDVLRAQVLEDARKHEVFHLMRIQE